MEGTFVKTEEGMLFSLLYISCALTTQRLFKTPLYMLWRIQSISQLELNKKNLVMNQAYLSYSDHIQ
jgi:hypothetical protein